MYWNQSACVQVDGKKTEAVKIKRGTRQGCVLSAQFFNIYSEYIFKEALVNINHGVKIGDLVINNLRYADDTVLLATSINDLQIILDKITTVCEKYGLKLNTSKTKFMVVTKVKSRIPNISLKAYGIDLERTTAVTYLGTYIHEDWNIQKRN